MLRLLFTTKDNSKQLTVVTDGIDSQLNVFVTENVIGDVEYYRSIGLIVEVGQTYSIGKFIELAELHSLKLISYPEGYNEEANVLVESREIRYVFTTEQEKITLPNTGDETRVVITSYKQEYEDNQPIGNVLPVSVRFVATTPFSVSEGGLVVVAENPTEQIRTGVLTAVQGESNNIITIDLEQPASDIEIQYQIDMVPAELNFPGRGATLRSTIDSNKITVINGVERIREPLNVTYHFDADDNHFSVSREGNDLIVTAKPNDSIGARISNTLNIDQQELGGESFGLSLEQEVAEVTYNYTLQVEPDTLSFPVNGGTDILQVTAKKQMMVNGKPSGGAVAVEYSTTVEGEGFSKGSSEYGIVASENTTGALRNGTATVSLSEGDRSVEVRLVQDAN